MTEDERLELLTLRLERESLYHRLKRAGAQGSALDVMLANVLEQGRMSTAARNAADNLVRAASALLAAFDKGDVDISHEEWADRDGSRDCPEDDTCTCPGPNALNELARARDAARRELGTKENENVSAQ